MDKSLMANELIPNSHDDDFSSAQLQQQPSISQLGSVSSIGRHSDYLEASKPFDESVPRSSYIQGRSVPTTPSILSRTSSRSHLSTTRNGHYFDHSNKLNNYTEKESHCGGFKDDKYYYAGSIAINEPLYDRDDFGAIIPPAEGSNMRTSLPRAKSSSTLLSFAEAKKVGRQRRLRDLQPLTSKSNGADMLSHSRPTRRDRSYVDHSPDSWLHRAGLVIATEARESKGQTWLIGRDSSSSLVAIEDSADSKREMTASAMSSQLTSRFASARQSRHVSRRGSSSKDPTNPTSGIGDTDNYGAAIRRRLLAEVEAANLNQMTPDFVNARDAEELFADADDSDANADLDAEIDDIEVALLASKAGLDLGIGTWVDKLVGWALFAKVGPESGVDNNDQKD